MTVSQVLQQVDGLCPNGFDTMQKLTWLSALEGQLRGEIAARHEGMDGAAAPPMRPDTALLAEDGYAELYVHYLLAKIAQANGEAARCADAAAAFDEALRNYWSACTRRHMPRASAPRLKVM